MASTEIQIQTMEKREVPIFDNVTEDSFSKNIYPAREPAVLRGFDVGSCTNTWTPEYLIKALGDQEAKVHVSAVSKMDFIHKNFSYKALPFSELIKRASEELHQDYFYDKEEKYYLRSLGTDVRKDAADVLQQYPQLKSDLKIPALFPSPQFFSSVLRIGSSGVQMWTHYDIMDNMLMQICGRKRVVLFSPRDALNLYLKGDKSEVLDIDNPDLKRFPRFSKACHHVAVMQPGDILFIPALWFHNTVAMDFNVAVNVFWRHLNPELYDAKDVYGNKDLLPAAQALTLIDRAVKLLETLPHDYRDFYGRRMVGRIWEKSIGLR